MTSYMRTLGAAAVQAAWTVMVLASPAMAQTGSTQEPPPTVQPPPADPAAALRENVAGTRATFLEPPPADYIIGADDVLTINFWRDETMSGDYVVRPDGKISLPLINDVTAAGLTPEQLGARVSEAAKAFFESPTVSVGVKEINSRKVYITGLVAKPGPYLMTGPMTVVQLIAVAGGLQEFAQSKHILVMRTEAGNNLAYSVNYDDLAKGKNLSQNIVLRPGDTVVVR